MDRNAYPILPIGKVNLETGANVEWGTMWECWEEDENCCDILVIETQKMSYRVLHSAGSATSWLTQLPPKSVIKIRHDQTCARIGGNWMVVNIYPHTKQGLLDIKKECGKKSLSFGCFK